MKNSIRTLKRWEMKNVIRTLKRWGGFVTPAMQNKTKFERRAFVVGFAVVAALVFGVPALSAIEHGKDSPLLATVGGAQLAMAAALVKPRVQTPTGAVVELFTGNRGSFSTPITGINGVSPGGTATINVPTDSRLHQLSLQCSGGTAYAGATTFTASAGGTATVVTGTLSGGKVVSVAITTAGSGQTDGTYIIAGVGATSGTGAFVRLVISGGVGTTATLIAQGGGGWVLPSFFFQSMIHKVNGVTIRDIDPAYVLAINAANGVPCQNGEFTVYFSEPWRKFLRNNAITAWDLAGQGTYQITALINQQIPSPVITGYYTFDYQRNAVMQGGRATPYLRIISQHQYSFAVGSGRTVLSGNQIPIAYPILRLWFAGATPGAITGVDILQDGNMVYQMTRDQSALLQANYGFAMIAPPGANNVTVPVGNTPTVFDMAAIFDLDQRPENALSVAKDLKVYVYSTTQQNINVVCEALTDAYV